MKKALLLPLLAAALAASSAADAALVRLPDTALAQLVAST